MGQHICGMSSEDNGAENIHFSKKDMTQMKSSNINREYIIEGLLGSGSYGEVSLGTHRRSKV